MVALSANLPSAAQSTLYQLEKGGVFVPVGGSPTSLSGSFEWGPPVFVFDLMFGQEILTYDAIALTFQAGGITFRLNRSPLNQDISFLPPWPIGAWPTWYFFEYVDAFDADGGLLEAALHLGGMGSEDSMRLVFPDLEVCRNCDLPTREVVGRMAFSAVAVPRPVLIAARAVGADFEFSLPTQPGFSYRVQASTNLTDWTTLGTIAGSTKDIVFRDTSAPPVRRFYRAVTP